MSKRIAGGALGKHLPAHERFKNVQRGEQLPFWPAEVRCAPNEFLRSALFNARNRNQPRRYFDGVVLAMLGKGRITYRGEELRQDDATVWLQLVKFAAEIPLGNYVEFTPHAFCKAVGWTPTGDAYAQGQYKLVEQSYGQDVLNLVLAQRYLEKLLANKLVAKYRRQHQPEVLEQFEKIISTKSLDA